MNQAGSGIAGFQGSRYQKGHGFFGRMISGTVMPILKKVLPYLGKTALNTGADIISDLQTGETFKSSAKRRLKETGKRVGAKTMSKIKEITGEGKKRRKRRRVKVAARKKRPALKAAKKSQKRRRRKTSKSKSKRSRKTGKRIAKDFL